MRHSLSQADVNRIEALDRQRRLMAQANRYAKKGHREGLASLGYEPDQIEDLLTPNSLGEVGFSSAELARIRDKISKLRAKR
jgi:hypothetical protein